MHVCLVICQLNHQIILLLLKAPSNPLLNFNVTHLAHLSQSELSLVSLGLHVGRQHLVKRPLHGRAGRRDHILLGPAPTRHITFMKNSSVYPTKQISFVLCTLKFDGIKPSIVLYCSLCPTR